MIVESLVPPLDLSFDLCYAAAMNYSALKDMFPGASTQEIKIEVDDGWTQFNPSLSFSPVQGYRCIIRSSNYGMNELGQYLTNDPHDVIRTKNYIATLDSALDIVDYQPIQPCKWGNIEYTLVRGLEDARLYWTKDHWQVYGNLREHRRDGLPTIVTARLAHDRLINPKILDNFDQCQKNWMIMGNGPNFIYKCNPPATIHHGVYREEPHDPLPDETLAFRGSSQAIPRGSGYIAVTHEVDWATGHRRYFHRFCLFDDAGYLTGYTDPFMFVFDTLLEDQPMIEYCAGLVTHGNNFVCSLGYKDSRAFLATIPVSQVVNEIYPIS